MAEPERLDNTDFQLCPKCGQSRPDVIFYSWRAPGANLDIRCPQCGFALPGNHPQTQELWNSLDPEQFPYYVTFKQHASATLEQEQRLAALTSQLTDKEATANFVEAVRVHGFPLDYIEHYVQQYGEAYRWHITHSIDYLYNHWNPRMTDTRRPMNLDEYMQEVMSKLSLDKEELPHG